METTARTWELRMRMMVTVVRICRVRVDPVVVVTSRRAAIDPTFMNGADHVWGVTLCQSGVAPLCSGMVLWVMVALTA